MGKISFAKGVLWIVFFSIFTVSIFLIIKEKIESFGIKKRFAIGNLVRYFPFSKENSLKEWEEKILKGKVIYLIEKGGKLSYVRAKSDKAASALYHRIKLNINRYPVISWKWRVDKFPERCSPEKIEDMKEEDFAARIYVILPAAFFTRSKVIEYIWSEALPEGTSGTSGYSKNIKVLVLKRGQTSDWCLERRDIYSDYIKLFGEPPHLNVGAMAFMTDADSTGTSADAVYDEIEIGYR